MGVTYAQLRDWVLALPGTQEVFVERWNEQTLRCGKKVFVIGDESSAYATVKASPEDQAELIAGAPDVYRIAAYVGRYGWVRVHLAAADAGELRAVVEAAWRRTAPASAKREHDQRAGGA